MPKFKVIGTMDVGYVAVVEARNEDEARRIADESDGVRTVDWIQDDNGHDWRIEGVYEMEEQTND